MMKDSKPQWVEMKDVLTCGDGIQNGSETDVDCGGLLCAECPEIFYDAILKSIGSANKVTMIKLVNEITGLGLKEAKGLVDSAPSVIVSKVQLDRANEVKENLESIGGIAEVKESN